MFASGDHVEISRLSLYLGNTAGKLDGQSTVLLDETTRHGKTDAEVN
jgi:hypothetical protein